MNFVTGLQLLHSIADTGLIPICTPEPEVILQFVKYCVARLGWSVAHSVTYYCYMLIMNIGRKNLLLNEQ